jgi:NAD(P)-dependent dehydrogenase (short-subunit alcohol dehydrogenase family)
MSRVFITGSTDGLGLMAAQLLHEQGHKDGLVDICRQLSGATLR